MFEKVPYGVKVRVRGGDGSFIAEYAIWTRRFFPFLDSWTVINYWLPNKGYLNTFPTFELAKEAAMREYNSWMTYYKNEEEKKRLKKVQRKVVWKHP
jgi:hypothetical protein